MNDSQENTLSMHRSTEQVLDNNSTKWSANTVFANLKTAYSAKIAELLIARQKQLEIITGIAVDKQLLRVRMAAKAEIVGGKVMFLAEDTNNNELLNAVKLDHGQLQNSRDDLVGGFCQNIHNHAFDNLAALAAYGVTAADLTDLQTFITEFEAKVPQPRAAKAAKKAVTAQIIMLIKDLNKKAKRFDLLMKDYKTTETEFFNAYRAARITIDLGATHTKLKVFVKDANNAPVAGASVSLIANGLIVRTATTAADGKLVINKVKPGTFTIKTEKPGFVTKTEEGVLFKAGKELSRTITLQAGSNPSGGTSTIEAFVNMGSVSNVDVSHINVNTNTTVRAEISGNLLRIFASATPGEPIGSVYWEVTDGTDVTKSIVEFAALIGADDTRHYVNVFCPGPGTGHFKLTFTNIL